VLKEAADEEAIKEADAKKVTQENPSQEADETVIRQLRIKKTMQWKLLRMKQHTTNVGGAWAGENSLQIGQMMI
jgi:hypothetical protein